MLCWNQIRHHQGSPDQKHQCQHKYQNIVLKNIKSIFEVTAGAIIAVDKK
jgi:hypothetical protein